MTKEEFEDLVTLFRSKEHELEGVILKSQFILENFLPLMNHLIEMTEANKKLEAENAELRNELKATRERC